ncbi:MAG: amino acid adenylation domain-containing protein [Desulfobacterales bacterium]|nr:amino acid adenylation domain-containing protein [Desulfobacterales bacterium]
MLENVSLEPIETEELYPTSQAQRRMLDQIYPKHTAYNISGAYLVKGELVHDTLQRALNFMINRHESLRTVFIEQDESFYQKIKPSESIHLELVNLMQSKDPILKAKECIENDLFTRFDWVHGPLFRVKLIQLEVSVSILSIHTHELICDTKSLLIFTKELFMVYAHLNNPKHSDSQVHFPALRIQYKDYVAWQDNRIDQMESDKAYWEQTLSDNFYLLHLPYDYPRPKIQSYQCALYSKIIPQEIITGLDTIQQKEQVTPLMLFVTLINMLLFRYTGQEDILTGVPVRERCHSDVEGIIGCFTNILVLRNQVKHHDTFYTLLHKVNRCLSEAYDHASYPFDALIYDLCIYEYINRNPLIDVMIMYDRIDQPILISDFQIEPFPIERKVSRFDLTFEFIQQDDEFHIAITYNTDIFSCETIQAMWHHIEILAQFVIKEPDKPISLLEMLTLDEKQRILFGLNGEIYTFPRHVTLADMFEQQVAVTPNHLAVISENESLTYRELDDASQRLAMYLKKHLNISANEPIGVLIDRNEHLIIALLGILKTGAVYLPLDIHYPRERIQFMIKDTGCRVIVSDAESIQLFKELVDTLSVSVVNINTLSHLASFELTRNSTGNDIAYLIYTSGSTGEPKAVMVENRGFINMIFSQIEIFGIDSKDRVLQFSSASFDASMSEIFMALLSGATLVMISHNNIMEPERFIQFVEDQVITVITFPPDYLNSLHHHPLPTVKVIITAGEPAIVDDVRFYAMNHRCFNAYGPTETSVCATIHRVSHEKPYLNGVPIGRPIANTGILILDNQLNLVPIGVIGEICIFGMSLARGYLNQPELSAEKFLSHPFIPDEQIYRTGDLGRFTHHGEIEFFGRK